MLISLGSYETDRFWTSGRALANYPSAYRLLL